jgi:type IV pilus assembly protein PilM
MNIVGMDIGNGDLKMALRQRGTTRLIVERMPRNLVDNGRIVDQDSMAAFIKQAKRKNGISWSDCALVLPSNVTYFRSLTVPLMTEEQLRFNLPYEFRDYVANDSDEYFYDYAVTALRLPPTQGAESVGGVVPLATTAVPTAASDGFSAEVPDIAAASVGSPGIDICAAAVEKVVIDRYADILKHAGFKLRLALPREMAYIGLLRHYLVNHPNEVHREFCIIDIGFLRTTIDIYAGTVHIASHTIELGCFEVDQVISEIMGVEEHMAASYRYSNHQEVLFQPECIAVYERFWTEVVRIINFYNFDSPDNNLHDIYFCGGGAVLAERVKHLLDLNMDGGMMMHGIIDLMPQGVEWTDNLSSCSLALAMALAAER